MTTLFPGSEPTGYGRNAMFRLWIEGKDAFWTVATKGRGSPKIMGWLTMQRGFWAADRRRREKIVVMMVIGRCIVMVIVVRRNGKDGDDETDT